MLEVGDLCKEVGNRTIVGPVSFHVSPGQILAVMGPNGAGKSTLFKLIAGLMKPSQGLISWQGQKLKAGMPKVGMLSHQSFLYNALTGKENLQFYGSLNGVPVNTQVLDEVLEQVGLSWDGDEAVGRYSRGMQQRLAIARILVQAPELILLDEPQTGLDQEGQGLLFEQIKRWKRAGKLILLVTHSFDQLFELVDQVLILRQGIPLFQGICPKGLLATRQLYENTLQGRV